VLSLTDGGAYDNLGLETVDDFDPIIVSDAGAPFGTEETAGTMWPKQVLRALDIATDQSRALRKRLLFYQCAAEERAHVYAGIDSDPTGYPAQQTLQAAPAVISALSNLRTRLNPFSDEEQGQLINWGWLIMDVALRSYLQKEIAPPAVLPIRGHPLA
jgi:NTE family protein